MPIPLILHQMGPSEPLPHRWQLMRQTWLNHHPKWEHYLWTNDSLRHFVAEHYPDFLPLYDAYPSPIMRADAARYLLLDHFGGAYADLDIECLKPIDPLLTNESLLLPLEPHEHNTSKIATDHGMRRIIGNAFLAGEPGHPFWKATLAALEEHHRESGPLVATGPFLLTNLTDSLTDPNTLPTLLPSEVVYPVTNTDTAWIESRVPGSPHHFAPDTFAIHYWDGSWWKKRGHRTKLHQLLVGKPILSSSWDCAQTQSHPARANFNPLVSCLMVTGHRPHLARHAIKCFQRQTYPNCELVIIDDSGNDQITSFIDSKDTKIRHIRLDPENKPLGALRNRALAEAQGDYLCQWDDDDLSAPHRISCQIDAIFATGADACGLYKLHVWWPEKDHLAVSSSRLWECALLWRRDTISAYPEIKSGEDTPPVQNLARHHRIAVIDAPELYTYIFHGENTFSEDHWQSFWLASTRRLTGHDCRLKLRTMQGLIPCNEYLLALNLQPLDTSTPKINRACPPVASAAKQPPHPASSTSSLPKILIATPLKNAVPFLDRFFENLRTTDYPLNQLSLAFLESDSQDATASRAQHLLKTHAHNFAQTRFLQHNFDFHPEGPRWESSIQLQRRKILAQSRNQLLEHALDNEKWVLWIDADIVSWPNDILHQLLAAHHPIVTPHCVQHPGGPSFDLNTFVFHDRAKGDGDEHLKDGIYQPTRGATRHYLESFRDQTLVELDGIGGTLLMINADLHRDGLRFPARPCHGFLETEGLAFMARDLGASCWGLPQVEIIHD